MDEPRKLGRGASAVVGCFMGLAVLVVVGFFVALRAKRIEEERRQSIPQSVADNRKGLLSATEHGEDEQVDAFFAGKLALDGWGHPIIYRCPGPVHRRGFDFYSCGPNGKDDQGTFDDIVVGVDVATVGSRE